MSPEIQWTKRLEFAIPGPPGHWRRARSAGKQYFTDKKTRAWKEVVALYANEYFKGSQITGPVKIRLGFYIPAPVSPSGKRGWMKRNRLKVIPRIHPHTDTPDIDNYIKAVFDGITRSQVWTDDKLVFSMTIEKWWVKVAGDARTEIAVWEAQ